MQLLHGITAFTFRLKFFKLFFLIALSATILIGCERQFVSPIDPKNPSQTASHLAQKALSDLADTANKHALISLANAASELSETLAIDDGTSVAPMYYKLAKLANAATLLAQEFVKAGCEVKLNEFAETSVNAVKAYTIRDAVDMEQALQNLAQEAVTADKFLQQLPIHDIFIPFAFGYESISYGGNNDYIHGEILVEYDATIRPADETRTAMIEFLTLRGYMVQVSRRSDFDLLSLDVSVDPFFLGEGLIELPGIASVQPNFLYDLDVDIPLPPNVEKTNKIIDGVVKRYNKAWCQGDFGVIDSILLEESGLGFFDYAFVRHLADIYAEEIPETAEPIRMNRFYLRIIAIEFLKIYLQDSEKPPDEVIHDSEKLLDEVIEIFRQSVRNGNVAIYRP